jgi:hypothetical protein
MMPYRELPEMPTEPKKKWWQEEEPTADERALWVELYKTFTLTHRRWRARRDNKTTDPAENADDFMEDYRKRFGRI